MKQRRATSRILKKEKAKTVRQIILLGFLAVALLVIFIFVILPNSIRVLDFFAPKTSQTINYDTIPPRPPSLILPYSATNSAQIKLFGYAEPNSQVDILVDGHSVARVEATSSGQFSLRFTLQQGVNSLSAISRDKTNNQSKPSATYKILFDNQAPKIELEGIEDNQEIVGKQNRFFTLKGKTEPMAQVFINDHIASVQEDGNFSYSTTLKEGDNHFKIRVVDQAGNSSELELNVKFKP